MGNKCLFVILVSGKSRLPVPPASTTPFISSYLTSAHGTRLVRHGVSDVVDADTNAHAGEPLRILRVVGVLPGIAQVHVETDGHHYSAFVVVDAAPMGDEAVVLVGAPRAHVLRSEEHTSELQSLRHLVC